MTIDKKATKEIFVQLTKNQVKGDDNEHTLYMKLYNKFRRVGLNTVMEYIDVNSVEDFRKLYKEHSKK